MDLGEALRTTGAARRFTDQLVDRSTVAAILDDARFAPSGGNRQPWRVVTVEDGSTRAQLADLMRPTWNEYVAAARAGAVPFNTIDYVTPDRIVRADNELLEEIATIPVVLVVAADLRLIVATDRALERATVVPGASIYPFCWSILLAARARGLAGVLTTMLSASEPSAGSLLALPADHALAAVMFLGHPISQPTRLTRRPVPSFATIDTFDGPPLAEDPVS